MREVPYHGEHYIGDRSGRSVDNELFEEFKEFMARKGGRGGMRNRIGYKTYDMYNNRDNRKNKHYSDEHRMMGMMGYGDTYMNQDGHFDEHEARDIVNEMYHIKNDKKYIGEKYPMSKAHEVHARLSDKEDCTIADIYVAINAQYHDYCKLFEQWFGSDIDDRIIASAIDFWFEDDDFDGDKVWDYFNKL